MSTRARTRGGLLVALRAGSFLSLIANVWIVLPGGAHFCPWFRSYSAASVSYEDGWDISGSVPTNMTITPDIETPTYTGSMKTGQLTDP